MSHRLDPLLRPRTLAVVGASARAGSVGNMLMRQLVQGGYQGGLYAVNPRTESVEGVACYADLADLPAPAEHVVFAIPDRALEEAFDAAIAQGARAATLISSLLLDDDGDPPLKERIRAKAVAAGLAVCGGNGNGFYNFDEKLWVCGFETRADHRAGGVSLITHSGSVFNALLDAEARLDFNLAVSSGQELVTTAADYLDYALEQPTTRVVGLFLETVRDPEGFRAALEKANRKGIPVVALKVGRTIESARLAASHSGALVGTDGAYQALFERYDVCRVASIDELAVALMLFAQPHPVGPGGLATLHDSGGERALFVDLAADAGVPFAALSQATRDKLAARLDPGLPAVNPLDAWGTGGDYQGIFSDCLSALLTDEATALGALVCDRGPEGRIFPEYGDFLRAAHAASGKPVCLVSNHQGSGSAPEAVSLAREGFPVLDGAELFLKGVRHLFDHRGFRALPAVAPPPEPSDVAIRWRARLAAGPLVEAEALSLLQDFGIPAVASHRVESWPEALAAAAKLGYPVVLKSAREGLVHKSDVGGVRLGIAGADALARAYEDLAARLGPSALVAPMIDGGVEMLLGLSHDAQFGPVVALGFGGLHAELLRDVAFALPPFDAATARRLLDGLRLRPLLDGQRGQPPADIDAFCDAAARFSVLASALGAVLQALDVNPLVVRGEGCLALDALAVLRADDAEPRPTADCA